MAWENVFDFKIFSYFTYFFLNFFTFPRKRFFSIFLLFHEKDDHVLFKSRDTTDSSFALETPLEVLIILRLIKDEAEHGLIYAAFSRAAKIIMSKLFIFNKYLLLG